MSRFTQEQRQKIIRDFCLRRNADFDARLFEQEVREQGAEHPAHAWFEWDAEKGALENRVEQARKFAQGLRVSFKIEEIGRGGRVVVREVEAPFLLSPTEDRKAGGGYFLTDLSNPEHMNELCRQAAADLGRWLRRYEAALLHVGGSVSMVQRQLKLLDRSPTETEEAA